MTALTDREQAFLTMAKMAGIATTGGRVLPAYAFQNPQGHWFALLADQPNGDPYISRDHSEIGAVIRLVRERLPDLFPIVASTFEALTIERPELRGHYDRAKEAWEASQ